jgi:hypothetical protein
LHFPHNINLEKQNFQKQFLTMTITVKPLQASINQPTRVEIMAWQQTAKLNKQQQGKQYSQ